MRLPVLSVAALLVVVLGCGKEQPTGGPRENPNGLPGPTPTPATGDLSTATPDVTMTAAAWSQEFAADTKAANAKYNGKVIELTGEVHEVAVVSTPSKSPPRVVLKRGQGECFDVYCLLSDTTVWERVWAGSTVTVRGRLRTTPNWPGELEPAVIHKAPAAPAPTLTAEALAADVLAATGPDRRRDWESWEAIYLEGDVLKVTPSEESFGSKITLKGKGDCNPVCVVDFWERKRLAELKPGDKVKALGKHTYVAPKPGEENPSPHFLLVTFKKL